MAGSTDGVNLIQKKIWEGSLPLEIRLSPSECRSFDQSDPYLVRTLSPLSKHSRLIAVLAYIFTIPVSPTSLSCLSALRHSSLPSLFSRMYLLMMVGSRSKLCR